MILKVFIIDDDEFSLFLAQKLLEVEQFSGCVEQYLQAKDALQVIIDNLDSENLPQIILLDLNMPYMNGWEFLDALAPYQEQLLGKVKIYILTSSVDPIDKEKSENYKLVSGFVHKPLSGEELAQIGSSF